MPVKPAPGIMAMEPASRRVSLAMTALPSAVVQVTILRIDLPAIWALLLKPHISFVFGRTQALFPPHRHVGRTMKNLI
jgi:hypothetical protein